jgi:hypothetical protein
MTDNSDLLAPATTPAAKPKRGRPAGSKNKPAKAAPAAPPVTPSAPKPTTIAEITEAGQAATLNDGANKEAVYMTVAGAEAEADRQDAEAGADDTPTEEDKAAAAAALEQLDKDAEARGKTVDDGHAYELPPVSADYELAIANRVTLIGGGKREYAYHRLLRAGKKL